MRFIPHNRTLLFFAVIFLLAGTAQAETIRLKSGLVVEGIVVERAEDFIKVDIGLGIPVTYYLDEIESSPITAHTETAPPEIMPTPAPEPKTTQSPDVPSTIEPIPVATAPAPMMQKIASLPPWQAPRLSRDKYLEIQAQRARNIEQELINRVVFVLIEPTSRYWQELKDAYPLIRTIAESPAGLTVAAIIWLGLYAAICYPLMRLSHRFQCGGGMAWVPILQIFPLLRIAGKSSVWFLFLFFPLVNILAFLFVWMSIARRLQQPHWLGYLMLVPAVNVAILWYLALVPALAPEKRPEDIDTGIKFE